MVLFLPLPLCLLPGRLAVMIGMRGGNRTLWRFSTVFSPLLGPSWGPSLDSVMLGGEKGRREAWLYYRWSLTYDGLT